MAKCSMIPFYLRTPEKTCMKVNNQTQHLQVMCFLGYLCVSRSVHSQQVKRTQSWWTAQQHENHCLSDRRTEIWNEKLSGEWQRRLEENYCMRYQHDIQINLFRGVGGIHSSTIHVCSITAINFIKSFAPKVHWEHCNRKILNQEKENRCNS